MAQISRDVYLEIVLPLVPRILTQIDRRTGSPTKGCFDRDYWHHLSVDFPCIEKQESVLTLWLLYTINHPLNKYYGNKKLLEWIRDGVDFWCSSQRPNGSFDEWYPYENSMTATAFSTQCITEIIMQAKGGIKWGERLNSHISKAARWMTKTEEPVACNQEAGAVLALINAAEITADMRLKSIAYSKLNRLLSLQDKEGWFPEYGGADIGYSSVTLAYLAQIWKKFPHDKLTLALEKLVSFIANFTHLDLSAAGRYGSRNTEYILPLGPEILADCLPEAKELSARLRLAFLKRSDIGLLNSDHRYLLLHSYFYLQSYIESKGALNMPANKAGNFYFESAGIVGRANGKGQIVASMKKGGLFKMASQSASLTDCGWVVYDRKKVLLSSHFSPAAGGELSGAGLRVSGNLSLIPLKNMNTADLLSLRIYAVTLGRIKLFSSLIKRFLRFILIVNNRPSNIRFERNISIDETGVRVMDTLIGLNSSQEVFLGGSFSYALGPSTNVFRCEELASFPHRFDHDDFPAGKLVVERIFSWDTKLGLVKVNNMARPTQ